MSTPTLTTVPTSKIAPSTDNPRGEIDRTGEEFAGLCVSIKAVGFLQPILVAAANGNGKHTILDGHRRHAAALEEKLDEIPVLVLPDGVSEKVARLTANIQREDFSPVAEARAIRELQDEGLTQVQAADVLGKSERWLRERLRLLNMPEKTQSAYDAGALPLESLGAVAKLADQAPKAAEALAEAAAQDEDVRKAVSNDRLDAVLDELIVDAAEDLDEDGTSKLGCLVEINWSGVTIEAVAVAGPPIDVLKALEERVERAEARRNDTRQWVPEAARVKFDEDDLSAAASFGCFLSINKSDYITDATWLADRYAQKLEAVEKKIEKAVKQFPKTSKKDKTEATTPEKEKADKEKRKEEREDELRHREEARAANLELGQRAERALRSPKLSLEEAKLVALMAVGGEATDLGDRGLIYCYHDYQEETKQNNGKTKVTYSTGRSAGEDLVKAILAAKQPEDALGVAVRAMVLGKYADQSVVAQSSRSWWQVPGRGAHSQVPGLIDAIAEKRGVLPDAIRVGVEAHRKLRAEEAELNVLAAANKSRAKAGISRDGLLGLPLIDEQVIDGAVDARRLKEHDNGDEVTYTLTGTGKKRLEKLRAGEKERQAAK